MLRTLSHASATLGWRRDGLIWRPSWHRGGLKRLGYAAVRVVWFWMERSRQRRALAELDDHLRRGPARVRQSVLEAVSLCPRRVSCRVGHCSGAGVRALDVPSNPTLKVASVENVAANSYGVIA